MVSARLFRVALVSAALLWLVALAGVRAETPVTFKGSVFMADGFVDPADVKIVLTNNEGDEVEQRSTYLEIPQKFYKTFRDVRAEAGQGHDLKQKLRPQGEFKFHFDSVPAGTHTLDIVSIGVVFPQYRIEVSEGEGDFQERIVVSLNQDPNKVFRNPIKAKPIGSVSYFEKRSNLFSLSTLMKNPMYLIMGLTAVAAIFLPKLVDKDAMEEMQREMQRVQEAGSQQQSSGSQSRLQNNSR